MNAPRNADGIVIIQFRFPIAFSAICAISVIVLSAAYYYISQNIKESLIFFAACTAAAGQITASFYTARMLSTSIAQNTLAFEQAQTADKNRKQELEAAAITNRHDVLKYTIRFGERWNDPSMFNVRDTLREIMEHKGTSEDLVIFVDSRRTNIIHLINFLEEIGTAKSLGLIDKEVSREQFDHIVVSSWRKLTQWIEKYRNDRGNKKIWEQYESLFDEWKNS